MKAEKPPTVLDKTCCDRCIVLGETEEGVVLRRDDGKIILKKAPAEACWSVTWAEEENRRLAMIVESSDDAIISKTLDGIILTWNRGAERIYGYSAEEAVGEPISILFPPGHADELRLILERLAGGESISQYETVRIRKSGEMVYVSLTISPVLNAAGRMVGISTIARDISALKLTEETLRRLASIVESSEDAILSRSMDGTILTWNAGAERMYGYAAAEAIGRPIGMLVPPENAAELRQIMEMVGRGQKVSYLETVRLHKNGRRIDVSLSISPLIDAEGWIIGASTIARDITARKRAEEERRRLEEQIQHGQKLEGLGLLAGGIAHDFNNLLVGIMGNTDLAIAELSDASHVRPILADVQKASTRAAELCRQLLAYSGKGKFVVQALDLTELITDMSRLLEVAVSKKAHLQYRFPLSLPAIEADPTQMRQVIMNLVTNASEALGDEPGTISISTGVLHCDRSFLHQSALDTPLAEGDYVYFEVRDSGGGMDHDTLDKIFEPFFSTKQTGQGLGLAAVQGILRSHKGTIRVHSRPDEGTVFRALFPALGRPAQELAHEPALNGGWRGTGTVLVVDDEETVRLVARRMLEKAGFSVLDAASGIEALEIFGRKSDEISCILMDLTMPQMDGTETLQRLMQLKPQLPVLLSSGYDEQDIVSRLTTQGAAGFVQKPYNSAGLISKVKAAVEQKAAAERKGPR